MILVDPMQDPLRYSMHCVIRAFTDTATDIRGTRAKLFSTVMALYERTYDDALTDVLTRLDAATPLICDAAEQLEQLSGILTWVIALDEDPEAPPPF